MALTFTNQVKKMIVRTLLIFVSLFALTACAQRDFYDDDYNCSVMPLTNNPDLTNEKTGLLPQMGY